MDQLRSTFNTRSLPMLYARDARSGQTISLNGDRTENVDWYSEDIHKGHLVCLDCNVPVHFNSGSDVRDGSRHRGTREHFKTNPGQAHDEGCEWGKAAQPQEQHKDNGFRLNFNTSSSERFNDKRAPGTIPEGLQAVSLKGIEDLARFMRLNELERIRKSFAVFREYESDWSHFIHSDTDESCRENLINTVSMMARSGQKFHLSALELEVDKKKIKNPHRRGDITLVKGRGVIANPGDRNGIKHVIVPKYSFRMEDNDYERLKDFFSESGTYIAQGLAELNITQRGSTKFYQFEIRLVSLDQVMKGDLAGLLKENKLHQLKKQGLAIQPG